MKKLTINFYLDGVTSSLDAIQEIKDQIKKTSGEAKRLLQAALEKERRIFLYVRVPGAQEPVKCATGWKCSQLHWADGRVNRKFDSLGVNAKIEQITDWIKDITRPLSKIPFTKKALENQIDIINAKPERHKDVTTFENWVTDFIEKAKVKNSSKQVYRATFDHLKNFAIKKKIALSWETFNLDFYTDFTNYLYEDMKHVDNTVGKSIKTLKTFLREAFDRDIHTNLSFKKKQFKVVSSEADEIYLDQDEIMKIYNVDLSDHPHLENDRLGFVFSCWIGVRFSDFVKIRPHHITDVPGDPEKNIRPGKLLRITTTKTGEDVVIPFHPIANEIWEKCKGSLPNIQDNPTFNLNIKEIAALAKINTVVQKRKTVKGEVEIEWLPKHKMVKAHTCRRSFATNCVLMGVPTRSIMAVTGHRTEKSFNKYVRITKDQHAQIMMQHFNSQPVMKIA